MAPLTHIAQVTKAGCMQKTVTVTLRRWVIHPRTGKRIEHRTKLLAHDEGNKTQLEDVVLVCHLAHQKKSKRKAFIVDKILESPRSTPAEQAALAATLRLEKMRREQEKKQAFLGRLKEERAQAKHDRQELQAPDAASTAT